MIGYIAENHKTKTEKRNMIMKLSQEDITFLKKITNEIAETDLFRVGEAHFSEDGSDSSIELTYVCYVVDSAELPALRTYAYEVLPRYTRDDVIDYMFEHDFDADFRDYTHFNIDAFKAKCEEHFGHWTVSELNEFIDSIEIDISFNIDDYADKIVEAIESIVEDAHPALSVEDLKNPDILEAIKNRYEIIIEPDLESLIESYVDSTIEDRLYTSFVHASFSGAEEERYLDSDELRSLLAERDLYNEYIEYLSGYSINELVHKFKNGYCMIYDI